MEVRFTPLQSLALNLAREFAAQKAEQPDKSWSNETIAREVNSLEVRLPRGAGATTICHWLCNEFDCLTILPHDHARRTFEDEHRAFYPDHKPKVTTIYALKKETNLVCSDFEHLKMISETLKNSDVVLFDAFRVYSDNSAVKKLFHELGRTHRFVIFK